MSSNGEPSGSKIAGRQLKQDGNYFKKKASQRRAQQAFRLRKQAAQIAQDDRIATLENTVEQINSLFMRFVDSVIDSKRIQGDHEVLQNLLHTTKSIAILSRNAGVDSTERDLLEEKNKTPLGQVHELSISDTARSFELHEDPEIVSKSHDSTTSSYTASNSIAGRNMNIMPEMKPASISNPFGNGWFGRLPEPLPPVVDPSWSISPGLQIGVQMLRYTMSFAYHALLGMHSPEIVRDIFSLCGENSSKEQALFNIRWFLGPGSSEIYRLGSITLEECTTVHALPAKESNVLRQKEDLPVDGRWDPYINAFGIEEYLREKGAYYVDSDILEMSLQTSLEKFPVEGQSKEGELAGNSTFMLPVEAVDSNRKSKDLEKSEYVSASNLRRNYEGLGYQTSIKTLNTFNLAASLNDSDSLQSSQAIDRQHVPAVENLKGRIRVSMLLDNLARISICLRKGPAYKRVYVDNAIALSVVG